MISTPKILNIRNLATSYAQTQVEADPTILEQNKVYATRRFEYNFKLNVFHGATVAAIASLALGLFASKIFIVLGLVALWTRYSAHNHLQGDALFLDAYPETNHPQRVTMLREYLGLPGSHTWVPDAAEFLDLIVWKNPVPMDSYTENFFPRYNAGRPYEFSGNSSRI